MLGRPVYFEHNVSFHVVLKAEFVESLQFIFRGICLFMHYTCVLLALFRLVPLSPPPPPPPGLARYSYLYTIYLYVYTGCNRRNGPDFGRVFFMLNYTENPPKHLYPKLNGLGDNGQ